LSINLVVALGVANLRRDRPLGVLGRVVGIWSNDERLASFISERDGDRTSFPIDPLDIKDLGDDVFDTYAGCGSAISVGSKGVWLYNGIELSFGGTFGAFVESSVSLDFEGESRKSEKEFERILRSAVLVFDLTFVIGLNMEVEGGVEVEVEGDGWLLGMGSEAGSLWMRYFGDLGTNIGPALDVSRLSTGEYPDSCLSSTLSSLYLTSS